MRLVRTAVMAVVEDSVREPGGVNATGWVRFPERNQNVQPS